MASPKPWMSLPFSPILTVSSSMKNPLTAVGKTVDVVLEIWAIAVITALAGSFSTFFVSGDS